jgi:Heparan-alpha-glucosaminide N-acetyltransferase, catalytic
MAKESNPKNNPPSKKSPVPDLVKKATSNRIISLDQFRGYTVAGMFLVNFVGGYKVWCPWVLRHHNTYISYADTIMPHFLFCVGFAFRLTFGRRSHSAGLPTAYKRVVKRFLGLLLVSFAVYTVGRRANTWDGLVEMGVWDAIKEPLKRNWLQTLGQIAVTSIWVTPVIRASGKIRTLYMVFSGLLHLYLSYVFHFDWVNASPSGIDGGPLGFLTWSIPLILGTLTCDAIVNVGNKPKLFKLTFASILIMGFGYILSCGTRLYDLSPAELAQWKVDAALENAEKGKVAAEIKAIAGGMGKESAALKKYKTELAKQKKIQLQQKTLEILKTKEGDHGQIFAYVAAYPEALAEATKLVKEGKVKSLPESLQKNLSGIQKIESTSKFKQLRKLEAENKALDPKLPGSPAAVAMLNPKTIDQKRNIIQKKNSLNAQITKIRKNSGEELDQLVQLHYDLQKGIRFHAQAIIDEKPAKFDPYYNIHLFAIVDEAKKFLDAQKLEEKSSGMQKLITDIKKIEESKSRDEKISKIKQLKIELDSFRNPILADDPVWPSSERIAKARERGWKDLLCEPPFVHPPADDPSDDPYKLHAITEPPSVDHREWNYWMMSQRAGSLSYLIFAGGFSIFLYVIFYVVCDIWGFQLGLFRTYGTNALAGYVLFEIVGSSIKAFIPGDAPFWYSFGGFLLCCYVLWLFIRNLEKNNIYIKL